MNDEQIIELYWQRNEKAIQATKTKYGSYCHTIAYNILGHREDANECVNDTWLQAWNAMPPQRPARLRMFLAKITRNLSFNKFKAKRAKKRGGGEIEIVLDELEECLADKSNVESAYQAKELGQSINQFVRTLSERDGNIFVRRYFFTESVADISGRFRMTPNNVMVVLSRARQKLKTHLEREGYAV
ncbi:MAG TPA: RNA polymerase subunit sigma-70 [Syntrophomonas sp.]|nr:RNA polymerase subunit sigma-70 [Syntrophomonas sp.]